MDDAPPSSIESQALDATNLISDPQRHSASILITQSTPLQAGVGIAGAAAASQKLPSTLPRALQRSARHSAKAWQSPWGKAVAIAAALTYGGWRLLSATQNPAPKSLTLKAHLRGLPTHRLTATTTPFSRPGSDDSKLANLQKRSSQQVKSLPVANKEKSHAFAQLSQHTNHPYAQSEMTIHEFLDEIINSLARAEELFEEYMVESEQYHKFYLLSISFFPTHYLFSDTTWNAQNIASALSDFVNTAQTSENLLFEVKNKHDVDYADIQELVQSMRSTQIKLLIEHLTMAINKLNFIEDVLDWYQLQHPEENFLDKPLKLQIPHPASGLAPFLTMSAKIRADLTRIQSALANSSWKINPPAVEHNLQGARHKAEPQTTAKAEPQTTARSEGEERTTEEVAHKTSSLLAPNHDSQWHMKHGPNPATGNRQTRASLARSQSIPVLRDWSHHKLNNLYLTLEQLTPDELTQVIQHSDLGLSLKASISVTTNTVVWFLKTLPYRTFSQSSVASVISEPKILEHLFLARILNLRIDVSLTEILSDYDHPVDEETHHTLALAHKELSGQFHDFVIAVMLLKKRTRLGKRSSLGHLLEAHDLAHSTALLLHTLAPSYQPHYLPSRAELQAQAIMMTLLADPKSTLDLQKKLKIKLHIDHPDDFFQHIFLARNLGLQEISRKALAAQHDLPHTPFLVRALENIFEKELERIRHDKPTKVIRQRL